MKKVYFLFPIILAVVGTLALIGGELDDSPGLGGIGLILIAISCYFNYKICNKSKG
jgi:hypothetical protein